jgi:hypothetical protein
MVKGLIAKYCSEWKVRWARIEVRIFETRRIRWEELRGTGGVFDPYWGMFSVLVREIWFLVRDSSDVSRI